MPRSPESASAGSRRGWDRRRIRERIRDDTTLALFPAGVTPETLAGIVAEGGVIKLVDRLTSWLPDYVIDAVERDR